MARTDMVADALRKIGGLDGTTLGPGVVAADWAGPRSGPSHRRWVSIF